MGKKFYCAKCGLKLEIFQKAIPHKGIIMNLVKPHECPVSIDDEGKITVAKDPFAGKGAFEMLDETKEKKLDKLFDEFPFVKKLNKATAEHEVVTEESGDKRDKKHLREELVTSSAPLNVLDKVKGNLK